MKRTITAMTAGLAAVLGLVLTAGPASADPSAPPGGLDAAKKVVTARIDGRLATLHVFDTAIGAAQHLTAGHKATLNALVATDRSGLIALKSKVAGETTVAGVKADDQSMVNDYRIYLLVEPKVRLTIAADLETTGVADLRQAADKLAAAIATAKQAGKDTTQAEADLADLRGQTDAADAAISGKADALLAVAPGPDANAIHAQVTPVRDAVHNARTDLRKALADAKAIRTALGG